MSDPVKFYTTCVRARSCLRHMQAKFPPGAAERWLKKSCPMNGDGCDIRYQAGLREPDRLRGEEP